MTYYRFDVMIGPDRTRKAVMAFAREVRDDLQQEAVAVSVQPVAFHLV